MATNVRIILRSDESGGETCAIPCFNGALVRRLKARLPPEGSLDEAGRLLGALNDRTRLKLLLALGTGNELCVCDLAHVVGTSFSTTSHHLRKLRDLGLLTYRNDGRMAYYAVCNPRLAELAAAATAVGEAASS